VQGLVVHVPGDAQAAEARGRGRRHRRVGVHERRGRRVGEQVADLGSGVAVTHRHDQRAHAGDGVPHGEQRRAVAQHDGDPIALPDTRAGQRVGDRVHGRLERCVRDR
jgi:hypothetical protein